MGTIGNIDVVTHEKEMKMHLSANATQFFVYCLKYFFVKDKVIDQSINEKYCTVPRRSRGTRTMILLMELTDYFSGLSLLSIIKT